MTNTHSDSRADIDRKFSPRHPGVKRIVDQPPRSHGVVNFDESGLESPLSPPLELEEDDLSDEDYTHHSKKRKNSINPQNISRRCSRQRASTAPCIGSSSKSRSSSTSSSRRGRDEDEEAVEELSVRRSVSTDGIIKGPWTKAEDDMLLRQVGVFGPRKWSEIATFIPGRIGKQCRERWMNHLDPEVKKTEWTPAEDQILYEAQAVFGNKWSKISRLLEGRSENSVKNRWNSLCHRKTHLKSVAFYAIKENNSLLSSPSKLQRAKQICNERRDPVSDYETPSERYQTRKRSKSVSNAVQKSTQLIPPLVVIEELFDGLLSETNAAESQSFTLLYSSVSGADESFDDLFNLDLDGEWTVDEFNCQMEVEKAGALDFILTPRATFWNKDAILDNDSGFDSSYSSTQRELESYLSGSDSLQSNDNDSFDIDALCRSLAENDIMPLDDGLNNN